MMRSAGLASGPRDMVAAWLGFAAVMSAIDAVSFAKSTTHFGSGYGLVFELVPWELVVAFFAVWSALFAGASFRILLRQRVNTAGLVVLLAVWAAVMAMFGVALVDSAGLPGLTGGTKWWSCSVAAVTAAASLLHSERLPDRIDQVFSWIDESFTISSSRDE